MKKRPRVGIIGSGIFGLSCALNLDKDYDVTVFEQGKDILCGATYANMNRHHYGFHYPRSLETAQQCLESSKVFEALYDSCIVRNFDNYYCVSKENSKTTSSEYLSFCDKLGLKYVEIWPEDGVLDRSKIALCLKVEESVYDYNILKTLVEKRIKTTSTIDIKLRSQVVDGYLKHDGSKVLLVNNQVESMEYNFDYIINAMYSNYNRFCSWFDFKKRLFQFNLQEMDIIELPVNNRLGVTIQDGLFPSFIPIGQTNMYFLAHAETSQLIREVSQATTPLLNRVGFVESNWQEIMESCSEYIPLLKKAKYIRSFFVDRVVDATHQHDDARLTDITSHGNGCWSIFAGKIITCESIAKKIASQIRDQS